MNQIFQSNWRDQVPCLPCVSTRHCPPPPHPIQLGGSFFCPRQFTCMHALISVLQSTQREPSRFPEFSLYALSPVPCSPSQTQGAHLGPPLLHHSLETLKAVTQGDHMAISCISHLTGTTVLPHLISTVLKTVIYLVQFCCYFRWNDSSRPVIPSWFQAVAQSVFFQQPHIKTFPNVHPQ